MPIAMFDDMEDAIVAEDDTVETTDEAVETPSEEITE